VKEQPQAIQRLTAVGESNVPPLEDLATGFIAQISNLYSPLGCEYIFTHFDKIKNANLDKLVLP